MTIRLPHTPQRFPRTETKDVPANAWGTQWKYLQRASKTLVRTPAGEGLKAMRLD